MSQGKTFTKKNRQAISHGERLVVVKGRDLDQAMKIKIGKSKGNITQDDSNHSAQNRQLLLPEDESESKFDPDRQGEGDLILVQP